MNNTVATTPVPGQSAKAANHAIVALGLVEAANAIRRGEITSEAYTSALLQQARTQGGLNAFITVDEAGVLAAAREADKARAAGLNAPLLGVPLGVKDSYLTKGLATSLGIERLRRFVPEEDADAVRAIKDAGALVFGKNNLVEMSYGLTGSNGDFGQVRNPHAHDRVTGGSSSGSAAAVSASIVPASLGGDTVGSIRVPASLVGVVGFKPTTGRWPRGGVAPISHTLDTTGVFARKVEDIALVDHVMTGESSGKGFNAIRDLRGARLAYAPRQFLDVVDADVEARFRESLRQLRDAGAELIEVDLGKDYIALVHASTWGIFFHETMGAVAEFVRRHQIPATFDDIHQGLKPELRDVWSHMVLPGGAGAISPEAYQTVLTTTRPEIRRRLDEVFVAQGAAAVLQPTTPCAAPLIDQQKNFTIDGKDVTYLALANHTVSASSIGLPGISVPMGLSKDRLPIGLELDAPLRSDRALLDLASCVEAVLGPSATP